MVRGWRSSLVRAAVPAAQGELVTTAIGPLQKLRIEPGLAPHEPARYWLRAGNEELALGAAFGCGVEISYLHTITCTHCGDATRRSYGGGYCYRCFAELARCDLCVVSPDRCHFAVGTCREPDWGQRFCMRGHVVYLANSSGPKVGLTAAGNELGRWLDQGATQGLVILTTATRADAGHAEVALAQRLADRTDWRALVSRDAPPADLPALRDQLRSAAPALPSSASWCTAAVHELCFPVRRYPRRPTLLRLLERPVVRGNLLGAKGQYLLFDHGVFNVRHHTAYHVRVTLLPAPIAPGDQDDQQLELFE